jgi:mRNA interferase MazF
MRKVRPAVVISGADVGRLPLRLIVPLTGWSEGFLDFAWMVRVEPGPATGLTKVSAADAFQTRSVDLSRFVNRLGTLDDAMVRQVAQAVAIAVDYEPPAAATPEPQQS